MKKGIAFILFHLVLHILMIVVLSIIFVRVLDEVTPWVMSNPEYHFAIMIISGMMTLIFMSVSGFQIRILFASKEKKIFRLYLFFLFLIFAVFSFNIFLAT